MAQSAIWTHQKQTGELAFQDLPELFYHRSHIRASHHASSPLPGRQAFSLFFSIDLSPNKQPADFLSYCFITVISPAFVWRITCACGEFPLLIEKSLWYEPLPAETCVCMEVPAGRARSIRPVSVVNWYLPRASSEPLKAIAPLPPVLISTCPLSCS